MIYFEEADFLINFELLIFSIGLKI